MQKKNIIRLSVLTEAVAASLIVINSSPRSEEKPTCCKESMDNCPQKKKAAAPGMIWENFSSQFFSFTSASY
jgi:hypothetical protein